jgi:hypothetical protein
MTEMSPEDIAARGERIYQQKIAAELKSDDVGKFVVIDVGTGEYVLDEDDMSAITRAAAAYPQGTFHIVRVGSRTVGRIGGTFRAVAR